MTPSLSDSPNKRSALVRKNILFSFFIKGWSGVVIFLLAPITLRCLGEYSNGVWITISTMLVWIDTMDIGLGNGLRNQLAVCIAHHDMEGARKVVSSTFFMLVFLIIPILTILLLFIFMTDMYGILNVDAGQVPDLSLAIVASVIMVSGSFIFKFIGNLYMGLQMPAINNALIALGQSLTLISTFGAYLTGHTTLSSIAIINTASPLIIWLISYPVTFCYKYRALSPKWSFFDMSTMRNILSESLRFFIMQIAGLILFFSSSLLISRWFSPAEVTPYNLAYRYFYILMIFATTICMPFWNATTDAYEQHDMEWIKRANSKINKIMAAIAIAIVLFIIVSEPVYYIWIYKWQKISVTIPLGITVIMGIYQFILIASMRYSYFLNGVSALRLQLIFTVLAAVLFIPLAWLFKELTHKVEYLLLAMCIVNLPGLIVNKIQSDKIFCGKATGFWHIK